MDIKLSVSNLPISPVRSIDIGAHHAVPVYKGVISYIAPNANVGMIVDATKTVRPFRFQEISDYKGQSTMTMGLDVGREVEFVVVSNHVTLLVGTK